MTTGNDLWAGVDIGGTKTALVLSAAPPVVLCRREFPTLPAQGPRRALELIRGNLCEMLVEYGARGRLQAVGVSCGGPLDRVAGVIQAPPNLSTWVDVPIVRILEDEFRAPCRLENDANAGAVAEHRYGAGRGTSNMVFLTMGTGLGAGIVLDGRLYHGATDLGGEIGHVRLTRDGPVGYHKAGSVEGWASGGGVAQIAQRALARARARGRDTALDRAGAVEKLTARDVGEAAEAGDRVAIEIIRTAGKRLGQALAILIDVLNPECIVIGGMAVRLGERILAPARAVVGREALAGAAAACRIVPAELNERIGDAAALCVAMGI